MCLSCSCESLRSHWVVNIEKARFIGRLEVSATQIKVIWILACSAMLISSAVDLRSYFAVSSYKATTINTMLHMRTEDSRRLNLRPTIGVFFRKIGPVSLSLLKQQEAISCTNRRSVPLSPTIYALTCMLHKLLTLQTEIFNLASFGLLDFELCRTSRWECLWAYFLQW